MKTLAVEKTNLDACVRGSRTDRIVLTRDGRPVALVVGLEGLDEEQVELGISDKFWNLMSSRRKEKTISRSALDKKLKQHAPRSRQKV